MIIQTHKLCYSFTKRTIIWLSRSLMHTHVFWVLSLNSYTSKSKNTSKQETDNFFKLQNPLHTNQKDNPGKTTSKGRPVHIKGYLWRLHKSIILRENWNYQKANISMIILWEEDWKNKGLFLKNIKCTRIICLILLFSLWVSCSE